MPLEIEVTSVESRGVLWQANGGVTIRICTADCLGAQHRKQLTVQMIAGGKVVASNDYKFRRVMDRQDAIDRARDTKQLTFISGTYWLAR